MFINRMKKDKGRRRHDREYGRAVSGKRFLAGYMAFLLMFTAYVGLDTFVIARVYSDAEPGASYNEDAGYRVSRAGGSDEGSSCGMTEESGSDEGSSCGMTEESGSNEESYYSITEESTDDEAQDGSIIGTYSDDNIRITLREYRENDTEIYAADVEVSSPEYLKTAMAQGVYGRNVTAKASETASEVNAVLAVNGDFYGARESGYVIRNGRLYRNRASGDQEDLVIYEDGSFGIINEDEISAEQLISDGAVQTLSFGPSLVQDGSITVTEGEEVTGRSMASNPRTAIGIIDECHYIFAVSDGRTSESAGLSLYELADFMRSLGADTAYNLDGGGSSVMIFQGQVINNPTTGGSNFRERSVSDIVYIG